MRELEYRTCLSELCEAEQLVVFNESHTYTHTLRTGTVSYYYSNNSMHGHLEVEHRALRPSVFTYVWQLSCLQISVGIISIHSKDSNNIYQSLKRQLSLFFPIQVFLYFSSSPQKLTVQVRARGYSCQEYKAPTVLFCRCLIGTWKLIGFIFI